MGERKPRITLDDCPAAEFSRPLDIVIASESCLDLTRYPNGVANSVNQLTKFLQDEGHHARIIAPRPSPDTLNGAPVQTVPTLVLEDFPVGFPEKRLFRHEYTSSRPDIVHAAAPFGPLGNRALKYAQKRHIPSVAIYQTDIPRYALDHELGKNIAQAAEKRVAHVHNRATLTLAPSKDAVQVLDRYGVKMKRVGIWGRGVDTELFHPERKDSDVVQALRRELSPTGRPVIGYVGRLAPEKSVENLLSLTDIPVEIVIVGDGPSRDDLESQLAHRAQFRGVRRGEDLANHYAAFDMFVHTGLRETFGQTLQEAMATGLPVAAPAVGGPLDIVRHGETGLLYQPTVDNSDLRRSVEYLLTRPTGAAAMGEAGRTCVEQRTWQALGNELLRYYALAMKLENKAR